MKSSSTSSYCSSSISSSFQPDSPKSYYSSISSSSSTSFLTNQNHAHHQPPSGLVIVTPSQTSNLRLSRGILVPLYPTISNQKWAIAQELNLPTEEGMVLYLVKDYQNQQQATHLIGPRITESAWSVLWSKAFFDHQDQSTTNSNNMNSNSRSQSTVSSSSNQDSEQRKQLSLPKPVAPPPPPPPKIVHTKHSSTLSLSSSSSHSSSSNSSHNSSSVPFESSSSSAASTSATSFHAIHHRQHPSQSSMSSFPESPYPPMPVSPSLYYSSPHSARFPNPHDQSVWPSATGNTPDQPSNDAAPRSLRTQTIVAKIEFDYEQDSSGVRPDWFEKWLKAASSLSSTAATTSIEPSSSSDQASLAENASNQSTSRTFSKSKRGKIPLILPNMISQRDQRSQNKERLRKIRSKLHPSHLSLSQSSTSSSSSSSLTTITPEGLSPDPLKSPLRCSRITEFGSRISYIHSQTPDHPPTAQSHNSDVTPRAIEGSREGGEKEVGGGEERFLRTYGEDQEKMRLMEKEAAEKEFRDIVEGRRLSAPSTAELMAGLNSPIRLNLEEDNGPRSMVKMIVDEPREIGEGGDKNMDEREVRVSERRSSSDQMKIELDQLERRLNELSPRQIPNKGLLGFGLFINSGKTASNNSGKDSGMREDEDEGILRKSKNRFEKVREYLDRGK